MDEETVMCIYNGILFSYKGKKRNFCHLQKKMEQEIFILTNNIDSGKQHVFSYTGSRIIFKGIGQKTWSRRQRVSKDVGTAGGSGVRGQ